jgi:hypothetical protein
MVEELLIVEDTDDISRLLKNYELLHQLKLEAIQKEDSIRNKIKAFLKERKWDSYFDEPSKIKVSIVESKIETFDKTQLKLFLNEKQYEQVLKVTTFEKLIILNEESKDRIKRYLKKGINELNK